MGLSLQNISLIFSQTKIFFFHHGCGKQAPQRRGGGGGGGQGGMPPLFLKSYFARDVFLEIQFCVILQGIQNVFGPGTPRVLSGAWKSFKFIVLRVMEDTFVSQKAECFHFCSLLEPKLSPRQKEITHFTRIAFSENLFNPQQRGGGLWS